MPIQLNLKSSRSNLTAVIKKTYMCSVCWTGKIWQGW